jgi:hypothetical protein
VFVLNELGISIKPHNDIHFLADGNLAIAKGNEAIVQHARQRLKCWSGEWSYHRGVGVDWDKYILGVRPPNFTAAEAIVKNEILETAGIVEVVEFNAEFDKVNRGYKVVRCVVRTINDDELLLSI